MEIVCCDDQSRSCQPGPQVLKAAANSKSYVRRLCQGYGQEKDASLSQMHNRDYHVGGGSKNIPVL